MMNAHFYYLVHLLKYEQHFFCFEELNRNGDTEFFFQGFRNCRHPYIIYLQMFTSNGNYRHKKVIVVKVNSYWNRVNRWTAWSHELTSHFYRIGSVMKNIRSSCIIHYLPYFATFWSHQLTLMTFEVKITQLQ